MFNYLQKIGKALMVPVAVLPLAAILMGAGYWIDPNGWGAGNKLAAILIQSGGAILDNMAILFAIGVAYGMSKDKDGSAALAGLVAWLIVTNLLKPTSISQLRGIPIDQVNVAFSKIANPFVGILCGVVSSVMYNKYSKVELPKALTFFSGRRLVPIVTAGVMIIVSLILFFIWPFVFGGLISFGEGILSLGSVGAGIYGFFNRLLIPIGLHHALNTVFWFNIAGINDIPNFLGGAKSIAEGTGIVGKTGMYQAGFFPIMMFGLVGAACAFVRMAKPENKQKIKSIMIAAGFASFFTGVTEPIEFAFMFVAPPLFVVHALLTGLSVFIAAKMQWIAGFGFSAGFIDLVLSTRNPLATKWYMLLPLGIIFFLFYYFLFSFLIKKFNLKTPGREDEEVAEIETGADKYIVIAKKIFDALGGKENILNVDYCATRLRLDVKNSETLDEKKIKTVSSGLLKPSKTSVQIIIGPQVEFVANELKKLV
ncbi:MAG: N-acetylglucosamine-specific PTS transporter subunit IIBC [Fusobacteriaceae bacterium]